MQRSRNDACIPRKLSITWHCHYADGSHVSKAIIHVCLSVCLHDNSTTNNLKVFKLGRGNDLGTAYGQYDFVIKKLKVKIQGHKV